MWLDLNYWFKIAQKVICGRFIQITGLARLSVCPVKNVEKPALPWTFAKTEVTGVRILTQIS